MTEPLARTTDLTTTDDPTVPTADARVTRLTDRRGVLRAGVAVAGVGVVAACSSPPVPSTTDAGAGGASSTSSSATSGTESSPSSSASEASPSGGGTPTSEVPVGGAKFYPETKTVVTQPTAGTFKAFDTTCPHQGCAVGSVQGDQLVCPCHQSHFALATGDRVSGPAPTGLTPKTVTVEGGTFTVA